MPSLIGSPNERWPLSRAVDAMVASARRAGFPGLIWAVGIVYPSLGLGFGVVRDILAILGATTDVSFEILRDWGVEQVFTQPTLLPSPGALLTMEASEARLRIVQLVLLLPLIPAATRLIAGLASLAEPERWRGASKGRRPPRLLDAWRAGKGLAASTLGLLLAFPFLFFGAVVFLLGPFVVLLNLVELLQNVTALLALALMPVGLVLMSYGILLQVLVQLALHSLARNRRGCASALTHAWRLVKNSPWGALRAAVVDLLLQGAILLLAVVLVRLFQRPGVAVSWLLWCIVGVTRAGYWARTYLGLGGLATAPVEAQLVEAGAAR